MPARRIARVLLLSAGCAGCQSASTSPHVAIDAATPDARVLALADLVVDQSFAERPAATARLRLPGARHDFLPDDSLAAVAGRDARRAEWLSELAAIDREQLGDASARLAYDLARSRLEAQRALRVCRFELWGVSQVGPSWVIDFADAALAQPIETAELRAQALARYAQLPRYVEAEIAALRTGLASGYSAPRLAVDHVLAQLETLLAAPDAELPFASPAFRSEDAAFRAQFLALVASQVRPALARYRDFLRDEYAWQARATIAASETPGGRACYEATLLFSTTLAISPELVHARGHAALAEVEREMSEISARSFGGKPVRELLGQLRSDPAYLYRDAAHVMSVGQAAMERAWAALPRAFGTLPRARAILEPIPAFQAKTSAAHYLAAALDGSAPAAYRVRTYAPEHTSWATGEATAFHEIVPGHHLQIALANEQAELPRIARLLGRSGFSEGWALYAEQVADELGLYSSEAARLGMLNGRAWRAVRMVVDTGMHALGWSRERALAFMLEHTALSPEQAAQEIDRYIARPGQAPSYLLGYQEIVALRGEAERALGERFDLRAFHEIVLGSGSTTLPLLRERVQRWIGKPVASLAPRINVRGEAVAKDACTSSDPARVYRNELEATVARRWAAEPGWGYIDPLVLSGAFEASGARAASAATRSRGPRRGGGGLPRCDRAGNAAGLPARAARRDRVPDSLVNGWSGPGTANSPGGADRDPRLRVDEPRRGGDRGSASRRRTARAGGRRRRALTAQGCWLETETISPVMYDA